MEKIEIKKPLITAHNRLAEGPLYDPRDDSLTWVDIISKRVYRIEKVNLDSCLDGELKSIEGSNIHFIQLSENVGVLVRTKKPGVFLAGAKKGYAIIDFSKSSINALKYVKYFYDENSEKMEYMRANDGAVDPVGRYLVGTMNSFGYEIKPEGDVFSYDCDGNMKNIISNVEIPNGIEWSLDYKTMYFVDSKKYTVWSYDYDMKTGNISNKRVLIKIELPNVEPDGMAVSTDGCIWLALFGGSRVRKYSKNGELLLEIFLPAERVTCVTFGGKNLDILIITTASKHLDDESYNYNENEKDKGGELFCLKLDGVVGRLKPIWEGSI